MTRTQKKIVELKKQLYILKIEINSDYTDGVVIESKINKRLKLKEKLYHLEKSAMLIEERNKKLKIINKHEI